jgi:hypothetical protein
MSADAPGSPRQILASMGDAFGERPQIRSWLLPRGHAEGPDRLRDGTVVEDRQGPPEELVERLGRVCDAAWEELVAIVPAASVIAMHTSSCLMR